MSDRMSEKTSLGEAFPREQARLRVLINQYRGIGPAGLIGAALMEECLRRADRAVIEGDLPAMIAIYHEMREYED